MTTYEAQIWAEIRDLLQQLVENQNKLLEFYMGLEAEGEGRNKLQGSSWTAGYTEQELTELSNKDVS